MPELEAPDGPPPGGFADPGANPDGVDVEAEAEAASPSRSPLKALMHTDPDIDPRDEPGDEATGHAIVGAKKVANYLSDGDLGSGTPAILNFIMAAKLTLQGDSDGGSDDADPATGGSPNPALPDSQADIAELEEQEL